ncbi:hypothetical protein STEG23_027459, partial [Scotinomys teguina]
KHTSEECAVSIIQICHGPCKHQSCQGFDPHVEKYETQDPVTFEDVTVKITIEEWALLSSSQKKLYSGVMKETFLNLISTAQEEKFGDYCKDPKRKMGTQVIEKECGYACDNDCDKNQDPDRENIININMHPAVSVHERTLYVRNMIGHSSSYGYGRVETTELPSKWKKPTATSFIHQKHWKDISHSQSLWVLEVCPEEKLCKSQQFNEACTSLCFDQPQERTQTGENLNENDLTRDMYEPNGEVIHTEVKQFVGQLCEEAFSNSSDLVNHENSHIGKKRANSRQSGKTLKYAKCFEKHEVAVTGEKPYACEHCGKDFSERSSCTRHDRVHTAEKLFACKDFRKTFSYHSHLKSHELIHTGEKPYACKHGRKAFTRCSNLKTHERNHSGEKPYACKHCGKTFTSSRRFPLHSVIVRKTRTQVIEKECGYACDSDCHKNQFPVLENNINTDMHPVVCAHESSLCVRNMIGHSSSHGYDRVQTTELPSIWRKPTATAFIHQKHWKDISPSQSLQVLEISPEEMLCKSQQFNEACTSLCFDQPQERTQTGENLNENDLTRDTYGQNGEVIHTEVKQFVGQLCEEAFSNSSDLINDENSHIDKKMDNCRQSGKIFKYGKCFEKHEVAVTGEKPYACEHCGKAFSESSSCKRHVSVHIAEKLFACKDFRNTFSYHSHLKSHERNQTREKPYACKNCEKSFNWCSDLKIHEQIHTGEKPYACTHCGKAFTKSSYLKAHVQIHIGEKRYSCKYCGKAFNWNNNLKIHERIHTGEKPYACKHCGIAFTQSFHLKTHVQIHVGEKPYACKHCGKAFNRCRDLKLHERIHTGEKPYACKHCGKTFTQSFHLKRHVLIHTGEKPYACKHCGKAFNRCSDLKLHERIHTGEKPYACKHCGKAFTQSRYLKTHVRIHIGEKPYACEHCGKAFKQHSHLKSHEQIHTGEKPYACKHCGKAFNWYNNLRTHERIHTGEKPYACKHCGKAFTQSGYLKTHVQIHIGEKPYACKHCGKTFNRCSDLKIHERIHTGEKPYACKHCGKAFTQSSCRKAHERIHTGEKPYACKQCGKAFSCSSSLKTHEWCHNGKKPYAWLQQQFWKQQWWCPLENGPVDLWELCSHWCNCLSMEPVTLEDVAVKFTLEEWALMNSSQKKLYSVVMKETYLNLIFIGKTQEEKFGDDCKGLRRKMGTQVIEKECGYTCDNDCDKNQDPDPENIINIGMHPIVSAHESTLYVRNMIGHSSSHGYDTVQITELSSQWRKPTATSFIHQKHWKDISHSQSLRVLELSPEEKLCKCQQFNEACTSLCFDQLQERTQTGENLYENDLTRDTYGQNGEVIHKEVKQFVGQLCEEAFSNSSDLVNHENSHIGKERANSRQSGKTLKYEKCFEKHKVPVTGEKPYACEHCGKDFSERSSCTRHVRVHTAEKLFACKDFRKTFSYHSHLKSHELIHTAEKPYAWHECGIYRPSLRCCILEKAGGGYCACEEESAAKSQSMFLHNAVDSKNGTNSFISGTAIEENLGEDCKDLRRKM